METGMKLILPTVGSRWFVPNTNLEVLITKIENDCVYETGPGTVNGWPLNSFIKIFSNTVGSWRAKL